MFFDTVLRLINTKYTDVEDMSIQENRKEEAGPPTLENFILKTRIAARIFSSDLLIAPIGKEVSYSAWVRHEIEIAAVAYSIPVILVDQSDVLQRTTMRHDLKSIHDKYLVASLDDETAFIDAVKSLMPRYVSVRAGEGIGPIQETGIPKRGLIDLADTLRPKPSKYHQVNIRDGMHARRRRRGLRARV